MSTGLNPADPILVAAFRNALLHQSLVLLTIIVFLMLLWVTVRTFLPAARAKATAHAAHGEAGATTASPEPPARRVLRIGFGLLWVLDGALQAQPRMPGGLTSQVIQPAAATSP